MMRRRAQIVAPHLDHVGKETRIAKHRASLLRRPVEQSGDRDVFAKSFWHGRVWFVSVSTLASDQDAIRL